MKYVFIFFVLWTNLYVQLFLNKDFKFLNKNYFKTKVLTGNDQCLNLKENRRLGYDLAGDRDLRRVSGKSTWIGGLDAGERLHLAANTCRVTSIY